MSFALDVKKELTTVPVTKKCCQLAQIAGFLRFAGSMTLSDGKWGVRISTHNPAVARLFKTLIKEYFGTKGSLSIDNADVPVGGGHTYELNITPEMNSEGILRESGMLGVKEGYNYMTDGISAEIIKKRCCKKAYLRGAFLACGTMTDPAKTYHLELPCDREYLAGDVRKLINSFGLKARITQRRGRYVVYLKDGEQISDFLGVIGAGTHLLRFEDVRVTKEVRGRVNRINNCESANLQKSVNAAQKQIADIKKIEKNRGLDSLPLKLRQAAALRLENPELPLSELAAIMDPPLAKSGLNHRFAKLAEIAESIGNS